MTNSLVFFFFSMKGLSNINAAMQSSGGIIDNLQFTSHDWYASQNRQLGEMIEGNKKWKSHTKPFTCMFLVFKD